ncbi:HNH endonuclease signature motif containing protein [Pseudomonas aeruginosa]
MLELIAKMGPQDLYRALQSLEASFTPISRRGKPTPSASPLRKILAEFQERLASLATMANLTATFDAEVNRARTSRPESRAQRLAAAPRTPRLVLRLVQDFERNPDVVAEVLFRADGMCEGCGSPAPFLRASDSTPYLEVHHVVRLADGGEDTVENALALCPNCHRREHFGRRQNGQVRPTE